MRFIMLFTCLLLFAPRAYADCVSDCQASTYCGGSSWDCAHLLNACYRGCNDSTPPAYPWGAIAYDKESWAYGLSDAATDENRAKKSALRFCGMHGKGCKIVETFSNTCAAIAEDSDGKVGWATGDVRKTAVKAAIKECNKKSADEDCKLSVSNCFSE